LNINNRFNPDEIGIAFHWAGRAGKIKHFSASFIYRFTLLKNLTQRRKGAKKENEEKLW
jgi:hypothetical protein